MTTMEIRTANRLLLLAFALAASYTSMRAVGDSLFLARVGADSLGIVFVLSGLATAIMALVWYGLSRRWTLVTATRVSSLVGASLSIAAWTMLPAWHHSWWLLVAIYLLTELKGCVNTINVVTIANEALGSSARRRSWARVGLGVPLAGILVGGLISLEASWWDLRHWLLVSALLDLAALVPITNLKRLPSSSEGHLQKSTTLAMRPVAGKWIRPSTTAPSSKRYTSSSRFRLWIGVLIATKVVVLTVLTFLWKSSATEFFEGDEIQLTQYFGGFYACMGVVTLLLQLLVTRRLLSRRGITVSILVMPLILAIAGTALVFSPGATFLFLTLTLAKSCEVWRRSVHDTTLNQLYTRIARGKRRWAISFNTALVKPLAEVGASLFILISSPDSLPLMMLVVSFVWILATLSLIRLIRRTRALESTTPPPATTRDTSRTTQTTYSEPV